MTAIPQIPVSVNTPERLDQWIELAAPKANTMAKRLRLTVAVMDRAAEIGRRIRAETSEAA